MTLESKRVLIGVASGIVITLCAEFLSLYMIAMYLSDQRMTRQTGFAVFLLTPVLLLVGAIWSALLATRQPQYWSKRRAAGLLLLSPILLFTSLIPLVPLVVGYLGMPRRVHTSPSADAKLAAIPVLFVVSGAVGVWLLLTKSRASS